MALRSSFWILSCSLLVACGSSLKKNAEVAPASQAPDPVVSPESLTLDLVGEIITRTILDATGLRLDAQGITSGFGEFLSAPFRELRQWRALSLRPAAPYGKPLPPNNLKETGYPSGNMDMTGNVLLLNLDETTGSTRFRDTSGSGNDVLCTTQCPTAAVPGRLSKGAQFQSSRAHADASASLHLTGKQLSISLWATAQSLPGGATLIMKGVGNAWGIWHNGGKLCAFINDYTVVANQACATFPVTTRFRHIGVSYDGLALRLFLDGAQAAVTANSNGLINSDPTTRLGIGTDGSGLYYFWDGKIDEVAVWNRALNPQDFTSLYQRGALDLGIAVRPCAIEEGCRNLPFVGPNGALPANPTPDDYFNERTRQSTSTPEYLLPNVESHDYLQIAVRLYSDGAASPVLVDVTPVLK